MLFFIVTRPTELGTRLRTVCGLGPAQQAIDPVAVIIDIPDGGGYYICGVSEITSENIAKFVDGFFAHSLERQQLKS